MWVFWRDDDEEIKIGFFVGTTPQEQIVVKYNDENVLKAMRIVNYLNGGNGKTIPIGRDINDARNENQD